MKYTLEHCEEFGVPCYRTEYWRFDEVARSELANAPSVHEIINTCAFCTVLPLEILKDADGYDVLTLDDHLAPLKGRCGIYHLWIEANTCDDHGTHSYIGVYVGKGSVQERILSHIKRKWPENQFLWVTFYECENRLSKYYEQLFLDKYNFYLNTQENHGAATLYARWTEERAFSGTEFSNHLAIRNARFEDKS